MRIFPCFLIDNISTWLFAQHELNCSCMKSSSMDKFAKFAIVALEGTLGCCDFGINQVPHGELHIASHLERKGASLAIVVS